MERCDRADHACTGVVVEPAATRLHDAFARRQQRLRRRIAERHQNVRIDQFDLALDERQADLGFLRRRRPVARRAPWNDVGDVNLAAIESDRGDHPVEQLARASDEGQALDIFVASRRLADEHDAGLRVAVGKHQTRGSGFQRAAVELLQHVAQDFERGRGAGRLPRRRDCGVGRRHWLGFRRDGGWQGSGRAGRARVSVAEEGVLRASPCPELDSRSTGSSESAQSTPASR